MVSFPCRDQNTVGDLLPDQVRAALDRQLAKSTAQKGGGGGGSVAATGDQTADT